LADESLMHYLTHLALAAFVLLLGILRLYSLFKELNDPRNVPGPTLFPFIGRVHDLPIKFMWLKFHEWGKKC
jgi:hypothetical protein